MKGPPFFKTFDIEKANKIAAERMGQIGIDVRDPSQAVGTMSGGERQCLAISRAIYFGAKVLVLDEPHFCSWSASSFSCFEIYS